MREGQVAKASALCVSGPWKKTWKVLVDQVVEALRVHRRRQAEQRLKYSGLWRDEDLVFPSKTGSPMSWNNLVGRNLKPLMRAASLPQGTRPLRSQVVQETMGHAIISQTMDTYSHLMAGMADVAATALEEVLS